MGKFKELNSQNYSAHEDKTLAEPNFVGIVELLMRLSAKSDSPQPSPEAENATEPGIFFKHKNTTSVFSPFFQKNC